MKTDQKIMLAAAGVVFAGWLLGGRQKAAAAAGGADQTGGPGGPPRGVLPPLCAKLQVDPNAIWTEADWQLVGLALERALADHYFLAPTLSGYKTIQWKVARDAIAELCPGIKSPTTRQRYLALRPKMPLWWKHMWDRVLTVAWQRIEALAQDAVASVDPPE